MNDYYIYMWYNDEWGGVPFYIGKGTGRRYLSKSGRSIAFTNFINRWQCSSKIVLDGLTEDAAISLEKSMKKRFILDGYPIIDAESHDRRKMSQREGIAAKKASGNWDDYGRPAKEVPEFEKFLKKQKDGEMSVVECCKALGISRATWYNRVREVC